jgi:hypothetical protein
MKKMLVAALVLGLAGAAAVGAVGVTRLSNGQCPLTGRPIHCLSMTSHTATPAAAATPAGMAIAGDATAPAADTLPECPKTHRPCCCPKQRQAAEAAAKPAETPVPIAPAQNP